MKKFYIAGSGGMLGEAFYQIFNNKYEIKYSDIKCSEKWLSYLDFRNYDSYERDVKNFNPDYLFHLGAHTNLEYCELNKEDAYNTNTLSVMHAVKIANNLKIPLLFISTAGIFDGKKDLYDDYDTPNPLSYYGITKYEAEKYVINNCNKYLICRPGWMMGGGLNKDKKFVKKILTQIKTKNILHVVNDKNGTPTYTIDFANNVELLIRKNIYGLYNLVCEGVTSRKEVTEKILRYYNLENKIKIIDVESSYFKDDYFAIRPLSERLQNKKLNSLNLNIMRNWKICLYEYLYNKYNNYI